MSWNIQTPGDYINGPLTVVGTAQFNSNVGIGISPATNLHVASTSNTQFRIECTGTGAGATNRLQFKNASGAADVRTGVIEWYDVNTFKGDIRLLKAGGVQIRNSADFATFNLDDSGRLGAGASPDSNFRFTSIGAFATGLGGAYIETGEFNRYGLVVSNSNASATQSILEIRKAGNALAGFTAAGNLAFSPALGIDFGASSNAAGATSELLNDYEEGTWTPTIAGVTTTGTATYNVQTGRYTKVGNLVTVQMYIGWSGHTGSGDMRVSGLPFQQSSETNVFSAVSVGYFHNVSLSANNVFNGYVVNGSQVIALEQYPTGGGGSSPIPLDPAGTFILTASYRV